MSDAHGEEARGRRRVAVTWVVVGVAGVLVAALAVPRLIGGADEGEAATPPPVLAGTAVASPTATPTPTPSPSPTPPPTSTEVPTETPTETVLFQGGPATGPWQQLGTVAEITHPDAPASARYSYTNFWSDPAEENQPDELWDQLVIEVTDQLAELGTPVGRPAFGAAAGTEAFNSFGGMEDVYRDDGVFTAYWSAVFEDEFGAARAYFHFVVDFDGNVLDRRHPIDFRDDGSRTHQDNAGAHLESIRAWADQLGYVGCDAC